MPLECARRTSGGKGNIGKFIEKEPRICAAGVPSAEAHETVADTFNQYSLQDAVDSLIGDAIIPPPKPRPLPPLRKEIPTDKRYALYGDVAALIAPPKKTKFQTLVDDIKETTYTSSWKKIVGRVPDPVPMFPAGYDINGTTYGKKLTRDLSLYDIVMPGDRLIDINPKHAPGLQTDRKYCKPPFNPSLTYGRRCFVDPRGILMKCALTDDNVVLGKAGRTIMNFVKVDFDEEKKSALGEALAPNKNIECVPKGYAFGKLTRPENLPECLTTLPIDPERGFVRQCLAHLNSLRKIMSKKFLPTFFRQFYLNLKYYDKDKSGWLPKNIIYEYCGSKHIRFNPALLEPLLKLWGAYDGENCIEYKTFVLILNYKQGLPDLPKIDEFPPECLKFETTYGEMVKPCQDPGPRAMAGVPSGRYLDLDYPITPNGCCRAHRICLSQESDTMSCVTPSVLTHMFVSHRDMYAKREPEVVRRVFEAAGEKFIGERFNAAWEEAKKYHSQGWVCYETFRRALEKFPEADFEPKETKQEDL